METKLSLQEQIDRTLEMASSVSTIKASPFFKDKVLNKLFTEKEATSIFTWFTPQLQLATLVFIFMLNAYAFIQYSQSNYDTQVSNFAETYILSSGDSDSIFN